MKIISKILVILICSFSTITFSQEVIQLFNQKDLNGWYAFEPGFGKNINPLEVFSVEQNMIRLYGKKAGYLMSNESFQNFRLTVEFRWNIDTSFSRKNNNKNSGVMYLVPGNTSDMLWPKGIQFQIKEGATGDFILLQEVTLEINGEKTEAGKSVVAKRLTDATNPIGEWNTLVVTVKNNKITQELNSVLVNKGNNPSISEGRILLQYEGFPIDFRKVAIVKL